MVLRKRFLLYYVGFCGHESRLKRVFAVISRILFHETKEDNKHIKRVVEICRNMLENFGSCLAAECLTGSNRLLRRHGEGTREREHRMAHSCDSCDSCRSAAWISLRPWSTCGRYRRGTQGKLPNSKEKNPTGPKKKVNFAAAQHD